MATGTNGIATVTDCNSLAGTAIFEGVGSCLNPDDKIYTSNISSSYTNVVPTFSAWPMAGSTTYWHVNQPCKLEINIGNILRVGSQYGTVLTSWTITQVPKIRVGVTTSISSSTSITFSHYVDITPSLNSESIAYTSAILDVPYGNWYIRAIPIQSGRITNLTTSSGTASGVLYETWRSEVCVHGLNYCPPYSVINATGKFNISGSYADNQCVKYSSLSKKLGVINYTQNSNKTSNIIGFAYAGSYTFSGSTVSDWENFKDQYCGGSYINSPSTVNIGVYELTVGSGTSNLETWQIGYYYLVTAPSSYMIEEIYLTSSDVSSLNAGTNLTKSGSGTVLTMG